MQVFMGERPSQRDYHRQNISERVGDIKKKADISLRLYITSGENEILQIIVVEM